MSLVAKVFVVLNLVMSVAFLVFSMNVWTAQTKWQKMYEIEKKNNVEFLAKGQKREKELAMEVVAQQRVSDGFKKEIVELRLDRARIRDENLALQTKLTTVENARDMMVAENQEYIRENKRYFDEIVKLKGVVVKQQQAVVVERENAIKARNEKSEMENELNTTKQTLSALTRDKRVIEEDLALQTGRIERLLKNNVPVAALLGEDAAAVQAYVADAQVLAVKPDIGLVMISAGSQQQVKPGYQFTISRGAQYIGKVQVEKVYPDMCSARIIPGMLKQGQEIQVHDEAKSR